MEEVPAPVSERRILGTCPVEGLSVRSIARLFEKCQVVITHHDGTVVIQRKGGARARASPRWMWGGRDNSCEDYL